MRKLIEMTVSSSPGDLRYDDAIAALKVLREECVRYGQGAAFNNQLQYLDKNYAHDAILGGFWKKVGISGVTLVSVEEAKVGQPNEGLVNAEKASEFLERIKGEGA